MRVFPKASQFQLHMPVAAVAIACAGVGLAHAQSVNTYYSGQAINPYLSAPVYALTHVDPGQSDVAPYPLKRGVFQVDLTKQPRVIAGPVSIMTLQSTDANFMWGVSSGGVAYIDVSNGGFRQVAQMTAPGVKELPPADFEKAVDTNFTSIDQIKKVVLDGLGIDQTRVMNGIYGVVDRDNHVFYNSATMLFVFGLKDPNNPAAGIQVVASRDLSKDVLVGKVEGGMLPHESLVGLNMTYDGKLVVLGNNSISVMDRNLQGPVYTVRLEPDELVSNSVAVDPHNGLYFASDKKMHKVVWTGTKLSNEESDGAWSAPYDNGHWMPTVKFGTGTGSTPTLMGFKDDEDKLVVMTDGADRMKLVAFWRDAIPAGFRQLPGTQSSRIAGQYKVNCGLPDSTKYIQSEQSVATKGYGAFVVNNIAAVGEKDKLVDAFSLGPINKPATGAERVDWDPKAHQWKSVWTNSKAISITMAPTLSGPSDIVMINGYHQGTGWEMTGLDWNTGKPVYRAIFGKSNWGNGAYAQPQLFPNGDLLFNSVGGPIRVRTSN